MNTLLYLRISVAINIAIVLFIVFKRLYYSQKIFPQNTYAETQNKLRNDIFSVLPIEPGSIVFVGTSLTERVPFHEFFPCSKVVNRGIGSNRTEHVMDRISDVTKYKPGLIILEIGINDLEAGLTADSVFTNIVRIVNMVDSPLIVESLFPNKALDSGVRDVNRRLKEYCREKNIIYIDMYTPFAGKDGLKDEYTIDGTHLNGKGLLKWKSIIDPYINAMPAKSPGTLAGTNISLK